MSMNRHLIIGGIAILLFWALLLIVVHDAYAGGTHPCRKHHHCHVHRPHPKPKPPPVVTPPPVVVPPVPPVEQPQVCTRNVPNVPGAPAQVCTGQTNPLWW